MNERDKSKRHNVVLIGMPGVGKSTVGVVLAKRLGYAFMDSDLVIQNKEGRLLHEIIAEKGVEGFWQTEEEINVSIETDYTVIATGGSVIYGSRAMEHFKQIGIIVYLKLSLEAITERLGDL
ncbi:MAG: shikimate kinase, partial [Lachnospiraceae bacterium]|nr:shikimate kinase [Lachnospiraceae bacterium]